MTVETSSEEHRVVLEARHLANLAESIFTVWLGPLADTTKDNDGLRGHCPLRRQLDIQKVFIL